jgi:methyltransferase (TIGR00027 family)
LEREEGVAETALWIAAARARESRRSDRLFDDPWAEVLAGDLVDAVRTDNPLLPVRTRFFDDVVCGTAGWARQVVLLGAGMDTRAFRLPLTGATTVYEIDQPEVLADKDAALAAAGARPTCRRKVIGFDLRRDWTRALLAAGFDPSRPTVWLAESLLFFLPPTVVAALLRRAADLSDVRALIAADIFGTGLLEQSSMRTLIEQRERAGAPPPFCTDEPEALLKEAGWESTTIVEPGQSQANFGRLFPLPEIWDGGAHPHRRTYLVTAERNTR